MAGLHTSMTDMDGIMMNVTGINVSLYDSQRPLYFSRGFQITDFQVDGIPTYSGSTNQEYDTALYERVEVIRGRMVYSLVSAHLLRQ